MTPARSRELADLTGPECAAALGPSSIVVVPVGAIEHHGPHLPLRTDWYLAEEISARAVPAAVGAGLDVWRLPTLAVTKSDEHAWAPGTVWVDWRTFLETLVAIGRSVASMGARTVVFVNGHGGNVAPLGVALREIRRLHGLNTFSLPALWVPQPVPAEILAAEQGFGIHGGAAETSAILHLHPELVHPDRAGREVPEFLADHELMGFNGRPVAFGWLSNDFSPSGVIGDPTLASAAYGQAVVEHSVERVVASLAEVARFVAERPA